MKKMKLQILHTSDIHGSIYPHDYATMQNRHQGLGKLSTLIKKLKEDNSLLIDGGDIIQGSPLVYYHQLKHPNQVHPMSLAMNALNYDYIAVGNHEFNYGIDNLLNYFNNSTATVLNATILNEEKELLVGKPYDIKEINGLKVGVIGVTTQYIPNWEQPHIIKGLTFLDAFETTKKYVKEIRNDVDLLIVNYHGGFERDLETNELLVADTGENQGSKMINEIEGIDILLTGHQHRTLMGTRNGVFYSQPSYNGSMLNEINISCTYEDKWSFDVTGKHHLLEKVETDTSVFEPIKKVEKETQVFLDQIVGNFDKDYLISDQLEARLHKHPLVSFFNQVQLAKTHADVSLTSLGNGVVGFNKEVTVRNILGTYVYPNTLVVKKMTGHTLLKGLEKTAEFFDVEEDKIVISKKYTHPKFELYAYDMYDGIEYTIDVSKPHGSRITSITKNGETLDLNKEYNIVMNNYRSAGGGDYAFYAEAETVQEISEEIAQMVIDYVLEHKEITVQHKDNIKIVK